MNATQNLICSEDLINPLTKMGIQMGSILVVSHLFHLSLKVFYNSGPVAHILAGLVLGPVGLSQIPEVKDFFSQRSTLEYYPILGFFSSVIFMFHIGLEVDIPYTIRTLRTSFTISYGGLALNFILGVIIAIIMSTNEYLDYIGPSVIDYGLFVIMFQAETSPPAVSRVVAELKIATSNVGRVAVSCSLINDLTCSFLYILIVTFHTWRGIGRGILALLVTSGVVFLNKYVANWFNRRNQSQKYLRGPELFVIFSLLVITSSFMELLSFSSTINCFVLGLLFPREGKSMRTLLYKLTYFIHNFILPLYFGYIGFQFNVLYFKRWDQAIAIAVMVIISLLGKIGGAIVACKHLKLPVSEGILIGFLLNLKGHLDLTLLNGIVDRLQWTTRSQDMLLASIVMNTVVSGIGIAIYIKRQEERLNFTYRAVEPQDPESELRVLACVHNSRHAPDMIAAISALRGTQSTPITPYLMHLIELSEKGKSSESLYHELEQDELVTNEDDYGGNDVLEINEAMDAFAADTKIFIPQMKAISSFGSMYEDVCDAAEDLRVSLILLPFHKHQRIDGKMECGKDGIRTTNQRVLRHGPCSVGVIVSRGPAGVPAFNKILNSESVQQVATLFFGGLDDQEALACSKRIAAHRYINLTVIRFVSTSPSGVGTNMEDDVYLADFYNRYVRSAKVSYLEKHVNNGSETVEALREIGNEYSLFIVGKGKRGQSPLTTGMSDWEECPELGIVGDMLASSEFKIGGSVLIVQQHRNPNL